MLFGAAFVREFAGIVRVSRERHPNGVKFGVGTGVIAELMKGGGRRPFYVTNYELVFLTPGKKVPVLCLDSGIVDFQEHGEGPERVRVIPQSMDPPTWVAMDLSVTNLDLLEESIGEGADAL